MKISYDKRCELVYSMWIDYLNSKSSCESDWNNTVNVFVNERISLELICMYSDQYKFWKQKLTYKNPIEASEIIIRAFKIHLLDS